MTQAQAIAAKRDAFFKLHTTGCFVIPNPWNIGTARCLEDLGFKAVASTSAGHAHANGLPDGAQSLESVLVHLQELATAVDIPLNADFENGFSEDIAGMQENILRCIATGVAGLSIEDAAQDGAPGLYDFDLAVTRIKAARAAIDGTGHRVLLTARTEGFVRGVPDIEEAVRRIKAYADAGADCLYAPGIKTTEEISKVLQAAGGRALNFLNAVPLGYSVDDLASMGVRRISVGGTLSRIAMDAFLHAAQGIARDGSFESFSNTITNADLDRCFQKHVDAQH